MKLGVAALSLVFISCVAVADYVTRYETAVSLLYMVPIILSAWFSWVFVSVPIALLSGISDSVLTYIHVRSCSSTNILNSGIQSIFFIVFTFVLLALKHLQGRLKILSVTDPLTQAVNSRYFFEIGNAEIHRAHRYGHPFSLIYMDIDNFKAINDTLRHSAGDVLLREITEKVKGVIRKVDTMARLGGDEFAILLPETGWDGVRAAVVRIQNSLLDMKVLSGKPVTFSIGVITNAGRLCAFDELIKIADGLMYEAKHSGRNMVKYKLLDENDGEVMKRSAPTH